MPDADNERFRRELAETGPGLQFRLALKEAGIAVRMARQIIERYGIIQDPGSFSYAKLQLWRRQYIKSTEICSEAIDQLWDRFHWPPQAERQKKYQFRPKDPA